MTIEEKGDILLFQLKNLTVPFSTAYVDVPGLVVMTTSFMRSMK